MRGPPSGDGGYGVLCASYESLNYNTQLRFSPIALSLLIRLMIVGIDLGTTHSVAAVMGRSGPQLVANSLGEVLTPSVVAIDGTGKVLVGAAAREYQVTHPKNCASLFKREMGTGAAIRLNDQVFSAEQLSSLILQSLKLDAEIFLGQPVTEAVITVPAYFDDNQRQATMAAGRMAGLEVKRILNEPTAAALAYGMHNLTEDRTVIVLDLGGGTFDVSIVEIFDGSIEVKASAGERCLGGEDFTRALAAYLLKQRGLEWEATRLSSPLMVSRLIHQCERAKQRLSFADVATVRWPDERGEFTAFSESVDISVALLNQATQEILQRIDSPIRRAMNDANLTRDKIDQVLLVGGATRMPCLRTHVEQLFHQPPRAYLNPDEVVALGAAVQAGLISNDEAVADLVVTDVSSFSLGMSICRRLGDQLVDDYFLPIIDRNTVLPCSRVKTVRTVEQGQTIIDIHVYQGENRKVKDNLFIGSFVVSGIPPGPAGQPVDVRFTYDLNGVLEVEATIVATEQKVSHVLTKFAQELSPEQIEAAVEQMQNLKLHPHEQAINQHLLKRAERLYAEVPANVRDELGRQIDAFEATLLMQDPDVVDAARQNLENFIKMLGY